LGKSHDRVVAATLIIMENLTLIIKGELTDLNTYIDAERSNRFAAAKLKKAETALVAFSCKQQKLKPVEKIEGIVCTWYTKDKRKDGDNISFGIKAIYDGLVVAGILPNDSRKHTGSITHHFAVDPVNPRVEVSLKEEANG